MAERAKMTGGEAETEPTPPTEPERTAPTLAVSGIVLSKAQLMDALRPYVPNIIDLRADEDGEHFTVRFDPGNVGGRDGAHA